MKIINYIFALTGLVFFNSCVEHEVIPPPRVEVELTCSFSAMVDSAAYDLTEDVAGFYCETTKAREILPLPQPSKAKYYASMRSTEVLELDFIQIGIGRASYNAEIGDDPTVEQFAQFFNMSFTPDFSENAEEGVEIIFRDPSGDIWTSKEDSENPQDFIFTTIEQESDEEGDYLKFVANFNCYLYDDIDDPQDSVLIENAIYTGYFKR